jgi:DNA-binding response OmpR family regulator
VADVLIVDDDPDIRALLAFSLGDSGFDIREAHDGASALGALRDHAPDCMVLDLMMPGIDGFGVLEAMRAEHIAERTKIVILTCKADQGSLVRGWELGADEYLIKPSDPQLVALKLYALLDAPAPR